MSQRLKLTNETLFFLSADLCRAQERAHRSLAMNASLPNVRAISEEAATVWGAEALAAEAREQRSDARFRRTTELRSRKLHRAAHG